MTDRQSSRAGLGFGLSGYLLWGVFPLYFPLLEPAGTTEILALRMAWTMVVALAAVALTGRTRSLRATLRDRRAAGPLSVAAVLITVNWGVYIWAVNTGHVVEASLGYFINPLVTILLGVLLLHERLRPWQWAAVGIGLAAVVVIAVDYGRPPWIALVLAVSFGLYGYLKKRSGVAAAESLAVETLVLFVPAVVVLGVIAARGHLVFGHHGVGNALLLASLGVVTAAPLLMFSAAARRLPLSVLGLLQYLTPVLQFAVGVGIRHERVPAAEFVGFGLVWVALIVLTADGLRSQRAASKLDRAAESIAA